MATPKTETRQCIVLFSHFTEQLPDMKISVIQVLPSTISSAVPVAGGGQLKTCPIFLDDHGQTHIDDGQKLVTWMMTQVTMYLKGFCSLVKLKESNGEQVLLY